MRVVFECLCQQVAIYAAQASALAKNASPDVKVVVVANPGMFDTHTHTRTHARTHGHTYVALFHPVSDVDDTPYANGEERQAHEGTGSGACVCVCVCVCAHSQH